MNLFSDFLKQYNTFASKNRIIKKNANKMMSKMSREILYQKLDVSSLKVIDSIPKSSTFLLSSKRLVNDLPHVNLL